jgi:hypothetical protein
MKQKKTAIDFKKMEWSKVDRQKAEFFYNEAVEYNDTLIAAINNLNGKAFSLLAMALSVLSAAVCQAMPGQATPGRTSIRFRRKRFPLQAGRLRPLIISRHLLMSYFGKG